MHTTRLHYAGEEKEFIIVLFKSVHFELETLVSVEETRGDVLVLRLLRPHDAPPDSVLMKCSAESTVLDIGSSLLNPLAIREYVVIVLDLRGECRPVRLLPLAIRVTKPMRQMLELLVCKRVSSFRS
jgi:hypothetical protein